MTIQEAMDKGITAVMQEPWKSHNKYCRVELPVFPGRPHGVWGRIIDPCGNLALGKDAESPIDMLLMKMPGNPMSIDPNADEWEEWIEPTDYSRFGKRWRWSTKEAA
jgi:hypothetical protein